MSSLVAAVELESGMPVAMVKAFWPAISLPGSQVIDPHIDLPRLWMVSLSESRTDWAS